MPDGIRRSTVFFAPMTSVCPALCPPWKRTTPSACSVNQSTTLPLPSSPHWVPITTTFLPPFTLTPSPECRRRLSRFARGEPGELAQIQREAGGGACAPERLADAIVALAASDGIRLAGGEHRKACTRLVMVTAQVGEIDVQCLDFAVRGLRELVERGEGAGDRGRVGEPGARGGEHFPRGSVERGQGHERFPPSRR